MIEKGCPERDVIPLDFDCGITAGAFDLLHPGHLLFLEECKTHCDKLIVCLHVDPNKERQSKNKPLETLYERYLRLSFCKFVGEIIPYESELELLNILTTQMGRYPNTMVRFLGGDYGHTSIFTGCSIDMPVRIIPRRHSYSSSRYHV